MKIGGWLIAVAAVLQGSRFKTTDKSHGSQVDVAVTRSGGDFQRELGPSSIGTGLELRIIPGNLRAIFQFAADLDQIDMNFHFGSSSASVKLRCTVDAPKVLGVVSG